MTIRFVARALALATPAVFVLAAHPAIPAERANAPLRIVVLGDSLALGTGASDPANGLTFRIFRTLASTRPGSEISDYAIGGSRTADVTRLEVASIDPRSTDLVLVIVGGNDVVRRTPVATFARDYARLLKAIRTRVPMTPVVAFGVPDVARSPLFADSRAKTELLSREDSIAVARAAKVTHAGFVDLFAFTKRASTSAEFFSADDFHPSDAGYEQLATFALPAVVAELGLNSRASSFPPR